MTMERLTHLFVTHLHSDHTIGYPDLIFTPAVTGRQTALGVWGPPGMRRMTEHILEAWSEDIETRLSGGEPSIPAAYEVRVTEVAPGKIFEDQNVAVTAFSVRHGKWPHAYGFRFDTRDRSIVFSGDTTYTEDLIQHATGCDTLVHEAYSGHGLSLRTPQWQAYHARYHTSGEDLGRLASTIQPRLLLINHLLPFGRPPEEVVKEVRTHFRGEVVLAEDLGVY
jgi:ribonuclease BN (tRNA processing enzyme)